MGLCWWPLFLVRRNRPPTPRYTFRGGSESEGWGIRVGYDGWHVCLAWCVPSACCNGYDMNFFFVIRSTDGEEYVRGDGLLLPHSTPSYVIILTVNEKSFIACRSLLCRYYTQQQEQKPKQKLSKKEGVRRCPGRSLSSSSLTLDSLLGFICTRVSLTHTHTSFSFISIYQTKIK